MAVSSPKISVILPVYNGAVYLSEALQSILSQTFGDFEVLAIDDGSTDSSRDILTRYSLIDPRVKVFFGEHRGLATPLNDMIKIAKGDWIARMDQDDIALPTRFERQLQWLEETKADLAGSWVRRFGGVDEGVVKLPTSDRAIKMEMLFACPFAHPSVMMRASLVKELFYDPAWDRAEDYDLWERAAHAGWRMINVPEVLLLYRVHGGQISAVKAEAQRNLTAGIRERYWRRSPLTVNVTPEQMTSFFLLLEGRSGACDLDAVEAVLNLLLDGREEDERNLLWWHIRRLFMRAVAERPGVIGKWRKLSSGLPRRTALAFQLQLWAFRLLRLRPENERAFRALRRLRSLGRGLGLSNR